MTVGKLLKALEGVDKNLEVVTTCADHAYCPIHWAVLATAEKTSSGDMYEYYSDDGLFKDNLTGPVFVAGRG